MARKPKAEPSISEILADLGVSHVRDDHSSRDGKHTLFYAGHCIGRFDAHQVGDLIREHLEAESA